MKRRDIMLGAAIMGSGIGVYRMSLANENSGNIAHRFADTLTAHDIDAFSNLLSDDYINHQFSAAAPSTKEGMTAKQATVAYFSDRLQGIPDLKVSIETIVADGDEVAASFVYSGTHQGMLMGVAATGKPLRFSSCDIFRIQNGVIAEHWGMGDIAGVLAQIH